MSLRSLAVLATSFAFLLGACSDSEPSPKDASGGSAPITGGVAGSGAVAGSPNGGSAGSAQGGAAGTAQGGAAGTAGQGGTSGAAGSAGQAGLAGGGASGQAGAGGAGGAGGNGGGAGLGGGAGASGGQAGGGNGGRGGAGSGGGSGAGGAGGRGGAAGSGGAGGAAAYNPCPSAPAPCVILPFGDSITDGFGTPGGYRIDLFRRTLTDAKRITFVGSAQNGPTMVDNVAFPRNHEGHSGYTIDTDTSGHTGISPLVPTAIGFNPNIVLLMIGTNDINGNVNVGQAPTRLGNLIDAMFTRRQDMLVVVAQIVPGRQDSLNARIMTYNAAIPNLVATRAAAGRHIVAVDMYGAFTRDANYKTTLLADDLHPTPAGYLRMSDTWYAAIGSLLH